MVETHGYGFNPGPVNFGQSQPAKSWLTGHAVPLQLSLNPGGDMDDLDMPHTASSTSRLARSGMTAGRQNSLTSPHAGSDAVLRSYNLRVSHAAMPC